MPHKHPSEHRPHTHKLRTHKRKMRKGMNREDAAKNLLEFKKILDQAGIKFWLICGTLLGAVRDNDFVPDEHDIDLISLAGDLISLAGDWNPKVCPKLEIAGFHPMYLSRTFRERRISMRKREIWLDLFLYYYYSPANAFVYPKNCSDSRFREISRNLLETETFTEFLGEKFRIPDKSEELLASMYGDSWRVPQGRKGDWRMLRTFQPIAQEKLLEWIAKHPKESMQGLKPNAS